ncbi:hypothetical protein [Bacillus sp. FJAT-50079]|uniref:hypothetical protein n=1 Tax=Bacillus sp. FJAT-50079 TaxID=2833577 RepID=UPI001BC99631|nr:hypothetical protein [Bacillus sp. FJAT-50079]MBS4210108.1 hypothetical protein [Bacillus sp. FJAT-50079]
MEETLKQILSEIKGLREDVSVLKTDVSGLKEGQHRLETDVSGLKEDVSDLKSGQERIETKVDHLSSELRSNFKYTQDKLDEHRHIFEVVSNEIKGVKVDIEYLSSKTGRHDTELNNIINRLRG